MIKLCRIFRLFEVRTSGQENSIYLSRLVRNEYKIGKVGNDPVRIPYSYEDFSSALLKRI